MIDLQEILRKRARRILLVAEATTKKIVKKEFSKIKKDIIKQLKNG